MKFKMSKIKMAICILGFLAIIVNAFSGESTPVTTQYALKVSFNPEEARLSGEVVVTWQNWSGVNLYKIPLSLRNKDKEETLIKSVSVNGRPAEFEYRFEEDGEGFTGFEIVLSEPVPPGEICEIKISFTSFKAGFWYDYFHFNHGWNEITNWYPTVLVMQNGKSYPSRQELADFDVKLSCPAEYKYASSGMVESETVSNNRVEYVLKAKGIPDFGILLSKNFIIEETEAAGVKIRSYYFEKEKKWGKKLLEYAKDIVIFYKEKIGFYPQPIISILPGDKYPSGGYPICGNCVVIHGGLDKKGDQAEEFANWILAHEIGHQYFGFGHILEDADYPRWFGLSMGIYTDALYNSARELERSSYKVRRQYYMSGVLAGLNTTIMQKIEDLKREKFDWNNVIAHSKSSTVLSMLEQLVGKDTFWTIFKTYLEKHKGETVTLESFRNTCEEISGKELDWFFHQWYETPAYLDYRIEKAKTWKAGDAFITECKVVRKGDAIMPLTIALETSNGNMIRKEIDGWSEEATVTFKTKNGPARVLLDPDHILPLLSQAEKSINIAGLARRQLEYMEKYDEALRLYERSYSIGKHLPGYLYYLGLAYRNTGDYLSAIDIFKKIIEFKEGQSLKRYQEMSILEIGKTYDLMGRREEAEKQYRLAMKFKRTKKNAEKYLKKPFLHKDF